MRSTLRSRLSSLLVSAVVAVGTFVLLLSAYVLAMWGLGAS